MNNMEKIFKTIALGVMWYAIFVFVTNQVNPMLWSTLAKILAVVFGFLIIDTNLKD